MKSKSEATDVTRLQMLIAGHAELCSQESSRVSTVIAGILSGFLAIRLKWAESQRPVADDFNLFEVMEVEGDELCHSKILAWLLDQRIEHGTHAQGSLGFRLFLEELGRELAHGEVEHVLAYAADTGYWVHREVSGDEARVDIEIASRRKFLIHVEVKIHSIEGQVQTDREYRDLHARGAYLDVPESARHGIFLTLDGRKARNESFVPVGWNRVAMVLDKFAFEAKPSEVQLFARHYAKAVRKLSILEHDEVEVDDADIQPA
jgi:hypothetical protein